MRHGRTNRSVPGDPFFPSFSASPSPSRRGRPWDLGTVPGPWPPSSVASHGRASDPLPPRRRQGGGCAASPARHRRAPRRIRVRPPERARLLDSRTVCEPPRRRAGRAPSRPASRIAHPARPPLSARPHPPTSFALAAQRAVRACAACVGRDGRADRGDQAGDGQEGVPLPRVGERSARAADPRPRDPRGRGGRGSRLAASRGAPLRGRARPRGAARFATRAARAQTRRTHRLWLRR